MSQNRREMVNGVWMQSKCSESSQWHFLQQRKMRPKKNAKHMCAAQVVNNLHRTRLHSCERSAFITNDYPTFFCLFFNLNISVKWPGMMKNRRKNGEEVNWANEWNACQSLNKIFYLNDLNSSQHTVWMCVFVNDDASYR